MSSEATVNEFIKLWKGLVSLTNSNLVAIPVNLSEVNQPNISSPYYSLLDQYYDGLNIVTIHIKELIKSQKLVGEQRNQVVLDLVTHCELLRSLANYSLPREYYQEVLEQVHKLENFTQSICKHVMVRDWLTFQIDKTPKECKFCQKRT